MVAGLGIFVTSQYFLMVVPHKDFKKDAAEWAALGVKHKELNHFLHIPCAFIGLADVCIIKNRPLLLASTPPLISCVGYFFIYVLLYLSLVHLNHWGTSAWPYGFMKALGSSPGKWAMTTVVQGFQVICHYVCCTV